MGSCTAQVVARERMRLDCDKMQPLAARGIVAPCGPGREKAAARAESGRHDRERAAALPARRQPVARDEHAMRQRAGCTAVEIAELGRGERAVVAKRERGGNK